MSSKQLILIDNDPMLALAKQINEATAAAEGHARAAVNYALIVGCLLNEAKSQVPHGRWDPWLIANCKVAPRTARAYMRLAKLWPQLSEPERQRVADLPVREAVRAISTNPDEPVRLVRKGMKFPTYTDANRAAKILIKSATALRATAKKLDRFSKLNASQVTGLRSKLMSTLEAFDKMAEVHHEL